MTMLNDEIKNSQLFKSNTPTAKVVFGE